MLQTPAYLLIVLDTVAFPLFGKKSAPAPLAAKAPARPPGNPEQSRLAAGSAPQEFAHTHDPNSFNNRSKIEVQEASHGIPDAVEQAAMLYSVDQPEVASGILETSVRSDDLGRYAQRAWGMLFELYQIEGRRQDFDQLAVEFAAKFETSPPTWTADEPSAAVAPKAPASRSFVKIAGLLDAKAEATLKQALTIAEKNPSVRLDVAKVTAIEDAGCALMLTVLRQLKRARKECVLVGADKLAVLLAKSISSGEREREQTWLLLLDLYQYLGDQEAFEDAAVNYAITFEVSPPSFEVTKRSPKANEPDMEAEGDDDSGCMLEGIITAATDGAFAAIRAEAENTADVIVDVSQLRRMDFVAATNLMNLVSTLNVEKKTVRLVKASHLLTALWEVIGLDSVARIELRKA
ncbi:MAG: STAS domain-containing protein [Gammaproteobacteria bacterium]|nr:STAS domain-containing protein [Gammaproteobacteria bacterium]MBU1414412.1 STAS domain-containing protein [Gammaproteobacteria bacterium]